MLFLPQACVAKALPSGPLPCVTYTFINYSRVSSHFPYFWDKVGSFRDENCHLYVQSHWTNTVKLFILSGMVGFSPGDKSHGDARDTRALSLVI